MTRSDHSPRSVRAVVFDLDDTLYLERDYARSALFAVGEYLHSHGGPAEAGQWMWQEFQAGRRSNIFNALSDHFRLDFQPIHVADLVEFYRNHRPTITPSDQALRALNALRGRVKLGLISDGFLPAQQYKLQALNLADRFDAVLFTESLGRQFWKPSPVPFQRMAETLAVPHESCAYVADNPAKDFLAPNQLGWRTVQWVQDGQVHAANAKKPTPPGGQPQSVARSADELLELLGLDTLQP